MTKGKPFNYNGLNAFAGFPHVPPIRLQMPSAENKRGGHHLALKNNSGSDLLGRSFLANNLGLFFDQRGALADTLAKVGQLGAAHLALTIHVNLVHAR